MTEIQEMAIAAFRALDLAGMARVDFFMDRQSDRIYLNEVNTIPGFAAIHHVSKVVGSERYAVDRTGGSADRLSIGALSGTSSHILRARADFMHSVAAESRVLVCASEFRGPGRLSLAAGEAGVAFPGMSGRGSASDDGSRRRRGGHG